ncbi:hypothetical protein [Enterococcus casseliflavus]|uniref:hypothetical protein n=1 Tax=Enterococcus casseliflavus TaxID=37734 RepID=UPI0030161203
MKLKFGHRYFEITERDRVADNGACQMLSTQTYVSYEGLGRHVHTPVIAKAKFKKFLKEGILVYMYDKNTLKYYRFDLDKLSKFLEGSVEKIGLTNGGDNI